MLLLNPRALRYISFFLSTKDSNTWLLQLYNQKNKEFNSLSVGISMKLLWYYLQIY